MIEFYLNDETLAPLPHAEAVFRALKKQGIKVALNTGFTRSITDTILHRLRWDDRSPLIDQVICSDEVPRGRPYADMIEVLMDDLGIGSPAQVLKVGDTEVDVEEGRNAACGQGGQRDDRRLYARAAAAIRPRFYHRRSAGAPSDHRKSINHRKGLNRTHAKPGSCPRRLLRARRSARPHLRTARLASAVPGLGCSSFMSP